MTIGTNWQVCPVDASFSDYAAHDTTQQDAWRAAYEDAAEKARAAAFYQAAQAVVIAGIQAAAADNAADKQYDIANRQMQIAEEEYQRYKDHFICVEHALADDACVDELYAPDYETRANRAIVDVRKQFSEARSKLSRIRSRYCLADFSRDLCDLEVQEAKAIAAAKDAAYRYEETEQKAYDDRRFNRRIQVSNLGRNIQAQQVATYTGAMDLANQSIATRLGGINNFLGALSGGISGMIQANMQSQLAPSVYTNMYAGVNAPNPYGSAYNFNYGGPSPIGAGAGTFSGYGGMY